MFPSSYSAHSALSAPRTTSSLSHRPSSSASNRPSSSLSYRPISRASQRPHSRHARSRLVPFCQTLITQITGLTETGSPDDIEGDHFKNLVEYAVKNLESTAMLKAAASMDMTVMDKQIRGHALKMRIRSQDTLSEALEASYHLLKEVVSQKHDLDDTIKASKLPDHLQFLVKLSEAASPATLAFAEHYQESVRHPPSRPKELTWEDILAEEPFEGDHWDGILNTRRGRKADGGWDSGGSTPSLSPLGSEDLELDADDSFSSLSEEQEDEKVAGRSTGIAHGLGNGSIRTEQTIPSHTYAHRKTFEDMQARQYWREEWKSDVDTSRTLDLRDASTLGPATHRILSRPQSRYSIEASQTQKYIDERDLVREILMALQGRKNIVLAWTNGSYSPTQSTPKVVHLSDDAQRSIISSIAQTASTAQHLRSFVQSVVDSREYADQAHFDIDPALPAHMRRTGTKVIQTVEAFADAISQQIRSLESWCADQEEAICRARSGTSKTSLVVSLLSLDKALRDTFEQTFEVLALVVRKVLDPRLGSEEASRRVVVPIARTPAVVTTSLLDALFQQVQEHYERGDRITADAAMRVFVKSAEPVWKMMSKWMKDGMGLGMEIGGGAGGSEFASLDEEFFIQSSGLGIGMMGRGLLDPEFWAEGYVLREGVGGADESEEGGEEYALGSGGRRRAIPAFLEHVARPVLSAGKAVGLLRALGDGQTGTLASLGLSDLDTFEALVATGDSSPTDGAGGKLFTVSVDTLSRVIYDRLLPDCQATGAILRTVLVEQCHFWRHLSTIEDLYLMRRGDALSHFADVVFAKMDSPQSWADFHFLNTAFNDVVEASALAGANEWVQPSLVRFSYRGPKDKDRTIGRTVKAIDGLLVEYAVPFPLTYIFTPAVLSVYGDVFVFLLQIRRAKSVAERILVRGEGGRGKTLRDELKAFYAVRSRFSWFINAFFTFLTTYVIHSQLRRFHQDMQKADSLDEMIRIHTEHLDKIQGRCLLKPNTSALHRAVLSILDMSLHFTNMFIAFAGSTAHTHDVSRSSITFKKHHRIRSRRRRQKQRRNVIGFSNSLLQESSSSESSEEGGGGGDGIDFERQQQQQEMTVDGGVEPSYSLVSSSSGMEEEIGSRLEKISVELDGLVRFVRRGVESLAGGTSEAAPAFGVLAFTLEDWDG